MQRLERLAPWFLGLAVAVASVWLVYLGRGTTFSPDELPWMIEAPDLSFKDALRPHNGHLILIPRALYKLVFETFGSSYLSFRLLATASVVLFSVLMFVYVRRRLGALPALAPSLILLVFGADSTHVIVGNATTVLVAFSCGLGALLLVERGDRGGDIAACALLCVGVFTYSVALPFAAGIGVLMIGQRPRMHRVWIAAIPIGLYAAWWLWALQFPSGSEGQLEIRNVLLLPTWALQSFGAAISALTGAGHDFGNDPQLGPALGVAAAVALGWRLRRPATPALVGAIAIALSLAAIEVLVRNIFTPPNISRYLITEAAVVVVVASEAAKGIVWSPRRLAAFAAVAVMGLGSNIILLYNDAASLRAVYSPKLRAELTGLELAGSSVDPAFDKGMVLGGQNSLILPFAEAAVFTESPAKAYVDAAERYGPIGYTADELVRKDEATRAAADAVLAEALDLGLQPVPGPSGRCRLVGGESGTVELKLPPTGAALMTQAAETPVSARRFGDVATVPLGTLSQGQPMLLTAKADEIARPWRVAITGGPVRVCAVR